MALQGIKKIVVYSSAARMVVNDLVTSVSAASDLPVTVYPSHVSLRWGLRQSPASEIIMVFHASDRNDLCFLRSFRSLARETKLILILPDKQADTVSEGLLSSPRFIMFLDSDFSDVTAILERMLNNHAYRSDDCSESSNRQRVFE